MPCQPVIRKDPVFARTYPLRLVPFDAAAGVDELFRTRDANQVRETLGSPSSGEDTQLSLR